MKLKNQKLYPFKTPYLDLNNYELDSEIVKVIPKDFAKVNNIVALELNGKVLTVGVANPYNTKIIANLKRITNLIVIPFKCDEEAIKNAIKENYKKEKALQTKMVLVLLSILILNIIF